MTGRKPLILNHVETVKFVENVLYSLGLTHIRGQDCVWTTPFSLKNLVMGTANGSLRLVPWDYTGLLKFSVCPPVGSICGTSHCVLVELNQWKTNEIRLSYQNSPPMYAQGSGTCPSDSLSKSPCNYVLPLFEHWKCCKGLDPKRFSGHSKLKAKLYRQHCPATYHASCDRKVVTVFHGF